MKQLFLSFLIFIVAFHSNAQEQTISGRVQELESKEPLTSANVSLKGTTQGTTTDNIGEFSLKVAEPIEGKILVVSFIGMETVEIPLEKGKSKYIIELREDSQMLDEVVIGFKKVNVFSRRREEDLQKVPESVTAFSESEIQEAGIEGVQDFVALTPNVTFINSQNVGNIAITTRGISQVRNGDAPVAYVVDGVTLPSPNSINQELFDISLIEVMKGPQGALYGRNAIGGAVNIITEKPTDESKHFVELGYGNGQNFKAKAGSSGKIIPEKLLYRVGGYYKNRDGLIENETLEENVDFIESFGLRGQLTAFLSSRLELDAGVSYSYADAGAIYWGAYAEDNQSDNYDPQPLSDILGNSERNLFDAHLKLNLDLGKVGELEWISAYSQVEEDFQGDLDFTALSALAQRQRLFNTGLIEELRLTSPSDQRFRWILGAFLMLNQRDLLTVGSVDLSSDFAGFFGFEAGTGFAPFLERDEENDNQTLAFFGQGNFDLSDKIELSAALRYDFDSRSQTNVLTNETREENFDQLQPKFSIAYRPTEQVMLYGTYARGFRSGGFNAPGVDAFPAVFEKEFTDNFELGLKTSWLENRVIFNAAAFRINFQNQQIFIVDLATVAQGIINIDETISQGVELEFKAKPHPRFDIVTGYGLTDTKITSLESNPEWEGNASPLVARSTFNLGLQYAQPLNEKIQLIPRIDFEQRGELFWHVDNVDRQEPFNLLNARLYLTQERWNVSVYARNLTNTEYNVEFFAREFSGGGADIRWPMQPLSWGFTVRLNF
ncbi:MAG: TonB-dependent receptor [Bacteroidota bacterium]